MTLKTDFWDLEKHFWTEGKGFYRDNMARNAIMVFPAPVGLLSGQEIIDGLDGAPRWEVAGEEGYDDEQQGHAAEHRQAQRVEPNQQARQHVRQTQ